MIKHKAFSGKVFQLLRINQNGKFLNYVKCLKDCGIPPFLTVPFAVFRINNITLNLLSSCGYLEEGKFAGANKLTVAAAARKACGVLLTEGGAGEGARPREKTTD